MNRPPTPEGLTRVVRWALLLFFGYALLTGGFHWHGGGGGPAPAGPRAASGGAPAIPPAPAQSDKAATDCATQANPLDNFSLIATSLMPTRVPTIRTLDVAPGEGPGAVCGQNATLHYSYGLESGTRIFSNLEGGAATHAVIGGRTLLHGVEMGMLGMRPGGERRIALPPVLGFEAVRDPSMLQDSDKFSMKPIDLKQLIVVATVKLAALSPEPPSSGPPMRVLERRFTTGQQAQCGDTVQVLMSVWKVDGTKIFSTEDGGKPVSFTLGKSQMPFGIEQAVAGMAEDSQRTLILPPAYAKPLQANRDSALPADLAWPEETTLVEIHLAHIGEPAPAKATTIPGAPATPAPSSTHPSKTDTDDTKDDDDTAKP